MDADDITFKSVAAEPGEFGPAMIPLLDGTTLVIYPGGRQEIIEGFPYVRISGDGSGALMIGHLPEGGEDA